jgi:hypothetical protein
MALPRPSLFSGEGWETTNPTLTALYQGMALAMPQASQNDHGL